MTGEMAERLGVKSVWSAELWGYDADLEIQVSAGVVSFSNDLERLILPHKPGLYARRDGIAQTELL